ncbi:LLM class flavin-dependent oxidoreductase [Sphingobacterium shayense]|uniref:LLM class flavin-dependent oxidoreductase n=1 Tax=Sphingobacterium shayense TaxID=626343 RepID=UPI003CCDCEAE
MLRRDKESHTEAINQTCQDAATMDKLNYTKYWLAEHHNSKYNLSSSPSILINYIASKTKHIKVGSGGIMLNNHKEFIA